MEWSVDRQVTNLAPNMHEKALWYAVQGIPVFPCHYPMRGGCSCRHEQCHSPGKHPLTPHGFRDATKDPEQIEAWWQRWPAANIGIATGAASNLLVIDCDPRNGGPRSREELIERFGPIPKTVEVITGGDGRHIYFRFPGEKLPKMLGDGIDLKGNGGYVIAPPSLHVSGRRYRFDGSDTNASLDQIADAPDWLTTLVSTESHAGSVVRAARETTCVKGKRNDALASLAGSMRRDGLSHEAIEAALLQENRRRCDPPLPDAEVRSIAVSISRYEPSGGNPVEWPEIAPLNRPTPEPIPATCLPKWLGEMANAVALSTETPFEMSALLAIAVASSCIAGKVDVSPERGYVEPANVFVCPAMESGNRKTAVFKLLTDPLTEWERREIERVSPERNRLQSERKTQEARVERLRRQAGRSDQRESTMQEIVELESRLPVVPVLPRLFCDDVTPERLGALMQEQGERMAIFSDEGGVFEMLAGRYSQGVPNLDLWLKGHAVSAVRIDRQDPRKPPILMDRPTLTVGICPQPDVLASLKDKPGFRGRGLLARFLYALPPSKMGYRTLNPTPVPEHVEATYRRGIGRLLDFQASQPLRLTFSSSAYEVWKIFQRSLELQFREDGKLQLLKDWGGKLAGAAARLAGIFHMIEQDGLEAPDPEIQLPSARAAVELAACLISHTQAVFALMDQDPVVSHAEKIAAWLVRHGRTAFTLRDCFRSHQARFRRVNEVRAPLALLEEHAYIRGVKQEPSLGRPASELYEVNPEVTKWRTA